MIYDYPDAEDLVCQLLDDVGHTVTFLPDNAEQLIDNGTPVILVERIGGTDDGVTDRAELLVTVWGRTRPDAWRAGREVRRIIDTYSRGGVVAGMFIDATRTTESATQLAIDDPDERRVVASYRVDSRRQHLPD